MNVADVRREYGLAGLSEEDLAADPIEQFRLWLEQAMTVDPKEFTAMTLATADREGRPSARVVLLKGVDARGFVFYTHYDSRQGAGAAGESARRAGLLLAGAGPPGAGRGDGREDLARGVRSLLRLAPAGLARGGLGVPAEPADLRPRGARAQGARGRRALRRGRAAPSGLGGFRVHPEAIEFWQGRPSRLHDRLRYSLDGEGHWRIERLAP